MDKGSGPVVLTVQPVRPRPANKQADRSSSAMLAAKALRTVRRFAIRSMSGSVERCVGSSMIGASSGLRRKSSGEASRLA